MAAINFDDMGDRPESGSVAAALNWAGAILSVALIVGLAVWGWKLWQRDVTGIPVVRALEGPMRITPADPGGLASEYQGLAVNSIAEARIEEPVEQVVLAPAPIALDEEEDLAMSALAPMDLPDPLPAVELEEAPLLPVDDMGDVVATTEAEPEPSATDLAVAAALAEALGLSPEPAVLVVGDGSLPASTPRPAVRPVGIEDVSFRMVTDETTGDVDPASIPPGTRLVQLGAYGSADVARAEWDSAMARFGDYMVGKERVVQEAETGGRTFWRLRAMGFEDLADARRFCAVLVTDGANCIPVVQE